MEVELKYPFGTIILSIDEEEEVNEWLLNKVVGESEEDRQVSMRKLESAYLFGMTTPEDLKDSDDFMSFLEDKYEGLARRMCL